MKKDFKTLLAEEAKRFKQISEYSFIGKIDEAEDEEDAPEGDLDAELQGLEDELGAAEPSGPDVDAEEAPEEEMPADEGGFGDDIPVDDAGFGDDIPADDEVEVDVTDLVNTSNELKTSSDETNQKMAELIDKFNTLSGQMSNMDKLSKNIEVLDTKIKDVETEIVKRNPTPTEKIEMRSLDSFPYNIKLSDFWSDNADKLSDQSKVTDNKPKEYVLTKDDVDNYSESDIKNSFNEFEEEDI
jgi:hypothetical protein